jgi:hypothetical protein
MYKYNADKYFELGVKHKPILDAAMANYIVAGTNGMAILKSHGNDANLSNNLRNEMN